MPVEEGYPAYLAARLSAFYERAGRVETLGGDNGSVTIIGAVSPPGGDFSEPVTRHTQRFTACWWALDRDLAHQRHYPAIDWLTSYSLQLEPISRWWEENVDSDWKELRRRAIAVLQDESSLQQLVQLVGPESLSADQQWVLTGARLLREGFLQQNALHEIDAYTVPEKQVALLRLFLSIYEEGRRQLEAGASLESIRDTFELGELLRLRMEVGNDELERLEDMRDRILKALGEVQNDRNPSDPKDKTLEPGENRQPATTEKQKPDNESATDSTPSGNRRAQPAASSQTAPGKENS
jgi:V/A-type H+-transporting ATPase subunit A